MLGYASTRDDLATGDELGGCRNGYIGYLDADSYLFPVGREKRIAKLLGTGSAWTRSRPSWASTDRRRPSTEATPCGCSAPSRESSRRWMPWPRICLHRSALVADQVATLPVTSSGKPGLRCPARLGLANPHASPVGCNDWADDRGVLGAAGQHARDPDASSRLQVPTPWSMIAPPWDAPSPLDLAPYPQAQTGSPTVDRLARDVRRSSFAGTPGASSRRGGAAAAARVRQARETSPRHRPGGVRPRGGESSAPRHRRAHPAVHGLTCPVPTGATRPARRAVLPAQVSNDAPGSSWSLGTGRLT